MILRASMLTARRPSPSGLTPASSTHGRSAFSEPMRRMTSPPAWRVRVRLILSNFDCWPLRWSSTVRLPLLMPISPRSFPSRPSALTLSSQASSAPRFSRLLRDGVAGAAAAAGGCAGAAELVSPRVGMTESVSAEASLGARASGRLSAPVNTETSPFCSMRSDSAAPTRFRLSARLLSRLASPTSARGAVATTAPSPSFTTMSRMRTAMWPFSSRSRMVPPNSTE